MSSLFPFVYGSMYNAGGVITVTPPDTSSYTIIGATWTLGQARGVSLSSNNALVVPAGRYLVNWNISMTCGTSNQTMWGQIYGNGTPKGNSLCLIYSISNVYMWLGATAIINFSAGDTVDVRIRNGTATNNLLVKYCMVTATKVGG